MDARCWHESGRLMAQALVYIVAGIAAIVAPLSLVDSAIRARNIWRALMTERTRHADFDN
jgi:hypothetical protein